MQNSNLLYKDIASVAESHDDGYHTVYHINSSNGSGKMSVFRVHPGVELVFAELNTFDIFTGDHNEQNVIEFNFCLDGRIEYESPNGLFCYLGKGDCSVLTLDSHCKSANCPTGYFRSLTLYLYLDVLAQCPLPLLERLSNDTNSLRKKFGGRQNVMIRADNQLRQICMDIFFAGGLDKKAYYQIKVLELILLLYEIDLGGRNSEKRTNYLTYTQVHIAKDMKKYIDKSPQNRHSIDELTKLYGVNRTALQRTFKNVYGIPIAAYMKKNRLDYAAMLLGSTEHGISEIATTVGYENQSKFASAFREEYGFSPTDYRKRQQTKKY